MPTIVDRDRLMALAEAHAEEYANAEPFPHIVFDDFLPDTVIKELQEAFPGPEETSWGEFANKREIKLALRDEELMPEPQLQILREFNAQTFVQFIGKLTGIDGLFPDPDYVGGGLHQIRPGGVLKVHADFNLHLVTQAQRRINVLLYLNEDWDESYGGHLELWDKEMTHSVKRIAPLANRVVVFSTTSTSFHGHPDPLTCPPDRTRRSMAWYYYSMPEGKVVRHSTLFQARPGEEVYSPDEARRAKVDRLVKRARAMTPAKVSAAIGKVRSKIKR
jgi:Rps23 Pro-64 3,4-dihydroxylase Tpa1-like proline 4-hydroxylase